MKLWTVINDASFAYLFEDGKPITDSSDKDFIEKICNEHNAWVILMRRRWLVKSWPRGGWGVMTYQNDWPVLLFDYKNNRHDTPIAAILAADAWLREKGKGSL